MKDKNIAAIWAFFAGGFGAHKFYLGQTGAGVLYLIFFWTFIPSIIAFFEFIGLLIMDKDEFDRRYNGRYSLQPGNQVVVNMLPPPNPYGYPQPGYGAAQAPYPHTYQVNPQGYMQPHQQQQPHQLPGQMTPSPTPGQGDIVARLEKLNELRVAGLLTDEEFGQQKAKILESM